MVLDEKGCSICACNPCNTECTVRSCEDGLQLVFPPDSCCPVCTPRPICEYACTMALIQCEEGFVPSVDECGCGTCALAPTCDSVECITSCPEGTVETFHPTNCCPTCEPKLECVGVECSQPLCGPNQKAVIRDGQCCAQCLDMPVCDTVDCDSKACGEGFERASVDGMCCPVCLPVDRCAAVMCPMMACATASTTLRDGSCCYGCSDCRSQETDRKVCDRNDNLVCRPEWTGKDCTEAVPPGQLISRRMRLVARNSTAAIDADTVKWLLMDKVRDGVRREWVEVTQEGGRKRQSSFTLFLTCKTADPGCANADTTLMNGLNGSSLVLDNTTSGAASVSAALSLLVLTIISLLL